MLPAARRRNSLASRDRSPWSDSGDRLRPADRAPFPARSARRRETFAATPPAAACAARTAAPARHNRSHRRRGTLSPAARPASAYIATPAPPRRRRDRRAGSAAAAPPARRADAKSPSTAYRLQSISIPNPARAQKAPCDTEDETTRTHTVHPACSSPSATGREPHRGALPATSSGSSARAPDRQRKFPAARERQSPPAQPPERPPAPSSTLPCNPKFPPSK